MIPRVMILDDEQDFVDAFSSLLKLKGIFVVGVAHNGKDIVNLCKNLNPDIVFSDVRMPYYDGYYVAKEICKMSARPKLVLITGSPTAEITTSLHNLEVDAIICKPIDIERILELIKDFSN